MKIKEHNDLQQANRTEGLYLPQNKLAKKIIDISKK